jgi:hypothetical protein
MTFSQLKIKKFKNEKNGVAIILLTMAYAWTI